MRTDRRGFLSRVLGATVGGYLAPWEKLRVWKPRAVGPSFDDTLTVTKAIYPGVIEDNFFREDPLYTHFLRQGQLTQSEFARLRAARRQRESRGLY